MSVLIQNCLQESETKTAVHEISKATHNKIFH